MTVQMGCTLRCKVIYTVFVNPRLRKYSMVLYLHFWVLELYLIRKGEMGGNGLMEI
jgi:hypothetical protein